MAHRAALLLALAAVAAAPRAAHAFAACYSNQGYAPDKTLKLPPRARVVYYTDGYMPKMPPNFTATLGGKPVPLKITVVKSAPYTMAVLEVDSDHTGTLEISGPRGGVAYEVTSAAAAMPKDLPVAVGRSRKSMQHTSVKEEFDALALRLPEGTPAITAHLKLRRDAAAAWTELDVPVVPSDFDDPHPLIRVGELGCSRNYTLDLLKQGVDIEATITLVDGTTRPAKGLAAHVTLP